MGITQRVGSLLNYEIKIDLNKRINKKLAYIIICAVLALVLGMGYLAGNIWFWNPNRNYFEYQMEQISQKPGDSQTRVELAMAAYLNGDIPKAEGILRDILVKEPNNNLASLYLGLILSDQKKYNEAIPLLITSTKQVQGFEARLVYLYLGKDYLAVDEPKLAVQYLGQAEALDPGNPVVYYTMGQAYEKMNNTQKAVEYYEKALKLSPNYVEPEAALKNLFAKRGTTKSSTENNNSK